MKPVTTFNLGALLPLLVMTLGASALLAQGRRGDAAPSAPAAAAPTAPGELDVLPVQGKVYVIGGAGANITVQIDDAGIVVVDTGNAASSEKVIAAIRRLSDKRVRYIINTQYHDD